MYKLATNTGNVYLDGVQIAPCDSIDNVDYVAYIKWINNENSPEIFEEDLPITDSELKRIGANYKGYQIPFTNEDAIGIMQVYRAFQLGITNTNIKFSNGTTMPIASKDFNEFDTWFANNRNSYFI
jgi:hypothetical protein